jgi:STE24 endopeptidase
MAWVWCWLLTTSFTLVVQFVAPTWIMPMFNKFTPLDEGTLREAVMDYAKEVNFPLEGLFVIDGSRRSTKANAFFTGFGKRKRVALFDTLTEKQSTDELLAIVAHEIGHYKRGHIRKSLAIGVLQAGMIFFLLSIFLSRHGLYDAFFIHEMSTYTGLVFFGMLFSPIDLVLSFFAQAFSRKNEFEADTFARETTGMGEHLITALKHLAADSLQNLTPHPLYVKLHYSHPPLIKRIEALRD